MYNLTNDQKNTAKWLVNNVRAGRFDAKFKFLRVTTLAKPMTAIHNHEGTPYSYEDSELDLINSGLNQDSLNALFSEGLISLKETQASPYLTWECDLRGNIYSAVDSDFNSTDTSFINYLIPLANPSGFDEELTNRCFPILATGGSDPILWDSAVRTAGVILEERLREVGAISDPNKTGRTLVNDVFGSNGTLSSRFSVSSERDGYRELYSGIVGAFRNPSAHRLVDPSPEEGGAFIVFVNLLLKKLEEIR